MTLYTSKQISRDSFRREKETEVGTIGVDVPLVHALDPLIGHEIEEIVGADHVTVAEIVGVERTNVLGHAVGREIVADRQIVAKRRYQKIPGKVENIRRTRTKNRSKRNHVMIKLWNVSNVTPGTA